MRTGRLQAEMVGGRYLVDRTDSLSPLTESSSAPPRLPTAEADRGEDAGYVQHIIDDPLPGTPIKQVLMHVAYGDHQVSVLSALVQARTMGVPIHCPIAREGRFPKDPAWGLADAVPGESTSAIVIWDSGMAPLPFEATPPREGDDSHEDPRADIDARRQKAAFSFDGEFIDVCGGEACLADHVS